ncbi:hypothetical protein, partial [Halarchaeum acidiphilum]|uniref:hypothetical protein n=1 Tax=Halarchaeum acidiphilum TaxID=489138 RepID=UPI0005D270C5
MEWSPDRGLQFRMAITLCGVLVVSLALLALAFALAYALCVAGAAPTEWRTPVAAALAVAALE